MLLLEGLNVCSANRRQRSRASRRCLLRISKSWRVDKSCRYSAAKIKISKQLHATSIDRSPFRYTTTRRHNEFLTTTTHLLRSFIHHIVNTYPPYTTHAIPHPKSLNPARPQARNRLPPSPQRAQHPTRTRVHSWPELSPDRLFRALPPTISLHPAPRRRPHHLQPPLLRTKCVPHAREVPPENRHPLTAEPTHTTSCLLHDVPTAVTEHYTPTTVDDALREAVQFDRGAHREDARAQAE